jgi:hypothetical protein
MPIRQTRSRVQTLDEMLNRRLLTPTQHAQIGAWIVVAKSPERIRQMPAPLWRTLELASILMDVDADLMRIPPLGEQAYRDAGQPGER